MSSTLPGRFGSRGRPWVLLGALFGTIAIVVGQTALAAPPGEAVPSPKIYLYMKSAAPDERVSVDVSTIGAGTAASVSLKVHEAGTWRTLATRRVNRYASYQSYRYTTPSQPQTVEFRAVLLRNGKQVSASRTVSLRIVADASSSPSVSPSVSPSGSPSASPSAAPSTAPVILRAEIPGQAGEWMTIGKYQLRFGPTIYGEPAWRTVGSEILAKRPAAGFSIVLASVDYQMSSPPTLGLGMDVQVEYVGNDGVVYGPGTELSPEGRCIYSLAPGLSTGNPEFDKTGVGPGGYPRFYACAVVKDAAIPGGYWRVGERFSLNPAAPHMVQAAMTSTLPFTKGLAPLAPLAQGDWFQLPSVFGAYGIQFQQTVAGADAWKPFSDYSSSYRPPPSGWSIVLGNATIQNRGSQDASPFIEILAPDYIGGDGNIYNGYDELAPGGACPWIPSDMYGRSLAAGASFQITTCVVVPDSAVAGGVWRVRPRNPFLLPFYFYVTSG